MEILLPLDLRRIIIHFSDNKILDLLKFLYLKVRLSNSDDTSIGIFFVDAATQNERKQILLIS